MTFKNASAQRQTKSTLKWTSLAGLCVFWVLVCFSGCAKKSDAAKTSGDEGAAAIPDPSPTPLPTPDAKTLLTQALAGYWFGACEDVSPNADPLIKGKQIKLTVAGTDLIETTSFYRDAACQRLVSKMDFSWTLDAAAFASSATSPGGYQVDLKLTEYRLTPLTSEVAADYNTRAVCDLPTGWFIYQPRAVTSLECEPLVGLNFFGKMAGSIRYDILKFDDVAAPRTLVFGNGRSGEGTTSATRPTTFATVGFSRP